MPTYSAFVDNNTRDGYSGFFGFNAAANQLYIGSWSSGAGFELEAFINWVNVTIPTGATVSSATITTRKVNNGTGTATIIHYCENVDSADDIGDATEFNALSFTSGVNESISTVGGANDPWTTVNLATPFGQVLARGGWASGNNILSVFKHNGTPTAMNYVEQATLDHPTITEPQVSITYSVAGAGSPYYAIAQQ